MDQLLSMKPGAFDFELTPCPMIYLRVSGPQKKRYGVVRQRMARQERVEDGENHLRVVAQHTKGFLCTALENPLRAARAHPIDHVSCHAERDRLRVGIGSSSCLFNNSCEITAVKGCGETLPARMRAMPRSICTTSPRACATIQENIRFVSVAQTEDVSNDRCRRNAPVCN
jgi:hypothetical protein